MEKKIVVDYEELTRLAEVLGIEEGIEEYFSDLDIAKMVSIYNTLKSKLKLYDVVNYMNIIINFTNYKIDNSLMDELLGDEALQDLVLNMKVDECDNEFLLNLNKSFTSELSIEEEIDNDSEVSDVYEGVIPLYETHDEEIVAFERYDAWRRLLVLLIYKKGYTDFIDYVTSLDKVNENEEKQFRLINIIDKLYSETCNIECVVNLKKDREINNIIEECRDAREDIANHNLLLTISRAKKYEGYGIAKKDLIQEGNIGLMRAIEKFNVDLGYKFSTYATWWIDQAIKRTLANDSTTIRVPVYLHELRVKYNRAVKILREQEAIEEPTVEEVYEKCQALGYTKLTLNQIKDLSEMKRKSEPVSADQLVGSEEDTPLLDLLHDKNYSTESYAELEDMKERVERSLKLIAKGQGPNGKQKSGASTRTIFKRFTLLTTDDKLIRILLTEKQYEYYIKHIREENGRERFIEFLDKYKIDKSKVTSSYKITDFVLTHDEREALVFRLRKGIRDEFTKYFLEQRNYNSALFEEPTDTDELTLEKTGILLGITRERARQIENKVEKKVDPDHHKKLSKTKTTRYIYLDDEPQNVFELFDISNPAEYVPYVPKNDIIRIDSCDNIHPLSTGAIVITLRNPIHYRERDLNLVVRKSLKETMHEINDTMKKSHYGLRLEYKKDNQ